MTWNGIIEKRRNIKVIAWGGGYHEMGDRHYMEGGHRDWTRRKGLIDTMLMQLCYLTIRTYIKKLSTLFLLFKKNILLECFIILISHH